MFANVSAIVSTEVVGWFISKTHKTKLHLTLVTPSLEIIKGTSHVKIPLLKSTSHWEWQDGEGNSDPKPIGTLWVVRGAWKGNKTEGKDQKALKCVQIVKKIPNLSFSRRGEVWDSQLTLPARTYSETTFHRDGLLYRWPTYLLIGQPREVFTLHNQPILASKSTRVFLLKSLVAINDPHMMWLK